ncbi:cell division protein FtsQ/DivIB [Neogemmobacter tilapiae]|uniref:Cell division protein FtsQ n=1 Tax=Neogemmobacter tilapiae TaxID=875041 RepID=A0A918WLJ3_9RHOB|nr:cell division protein FtsQ/DivIB [Gemmobacter tilapiae]GHC57287.1 cell division protein FtsQ [Gemmobacter tilapiae]
MRSLNPFRKAAPEPGLRRDPAPSRWAYRMERLWLTPLFRALMRVGLPAFVVTLSVGLYLNDETRRQGLVQGWDNLVNKVEQRPEFMVTLMEVEGANAALADAVRDIAALDLPKSSFEIDLPATQALIEQLDAVAHADLRIRGGGVLQVTVTEREPAIIWRRDPAEGETGLDLLDKTGRRVAMILSRKDRPDLPLIAGQGADEVVAEAMDLLAAAEPHLGTRLRGLVRMGERRWDVVLDRDQRILLPEHDPLAALNQLIAMDQRERLLARDILAVDLRLAVRPTIRLTPRALAQLRGEQGLVTVENEL